MTQEEFDNYDYGGEAEQKILDEHKAWLLLNPDPPHPILHTIPVDYDDAQHRYYLKDQYGNETNYISATTIVDQFHEEFDVTSQSIRMSQKYGHTPEFWRDIWKQDRDTSLDRGNGIHKEQERFLYNVGFTQVAQPNDIRKDVVRTTYRVYDNRSYSESGSERYIDLSTLVDGCYPELKLWRHDWRIAGRADKPTIETVFGKKYAHVEDYKTNKAVKHNGWVNKDGTERMMLAPLQHLPDCEYTHYCLQLSIYQYLLEYFGYLPGLRRLIHFPHPIEGLGTPDPKVEELPYLRDEVIAMLTVMNNNRMYGQE